ncbi:MAG: N-(5'-phosphoribosyl)anthranilate isomerase [Gemmatimonadetes bacterium]|nr:N-(5'-phosphoribosyl)anthranilate isomerase [Gemmatimonadota bacterium]
MPEVKICGVCRAEDAALAVAAGADYVGVVLSSGTPRARSLRQAVAIYAAASGLRRAGVFVNAAFEELCEAADRLRLDVLQLHGSEPPELVEAVRKAGPWSVWKAVRPRGRAEFLAALDMYHGAADAVLVDGFSARAPGGAGVRFRWELVARARSHVPAGLRFVIAGGLTPLNVGEAVRRLQPDVVDVSSGVEARVGEKSAELVHAFVAAARVA